MFNPSSPSNSEPPPAAAVQTHPAQQLHQHPLWRVASGAEKPANPPQPSRRGRGRGAPQTHTDPDAGARYERISLLAVELQQCATGGDGADSALLTSEDEDDFESSEKKHKKVESDEEEPYEVEDVDQFADRLSTAGSDDSKFNTEREPTSKGGRTKKKHVANTADMMATAAFGGGFRDMFADDSDTASAASHASCKRKRDSFKRACKVKGVECVGCVLANRIGPVEKFVNSNVGRMSENALWKMAALTWKLEVVEPAKAEGVNIVDWPWRDVANHFRLHTTNQVVGRTNMIQSLTAMRCQVEQRLVRVENGERELDKTNADLVLKILAAESRERTLLATSQSGVGRGRGSSQKPAGED